MSVPDTPQRTSFVLVTQTTLLLVHRNGKRVGIIRELLISSVAYCVPMRRPVNSGGQSSSLEMGGIRQDIDGMENGSFDVSKVILVFEPLPLCSLCPIE